MINKQVVAFPAETVLFFALFVARPETNITNDHMMHIEVDLEVLNANAVTGGSLTGNREIGINDLEFRLERNCPRDAENNGPRTFHFTRSTETAGSLIVEIGYLNHFATAAAQGELAESFSSRERRGTVGTKITNHHLAGSIVVLYVAEPT